MSTTIKTNDSDTTSKYQPVGTVVFCPLGATAQKGWTIREVDTVPVRAKGDTTSVYEWQNNALVLVAPAVTLATLSAALNISLTALFKTAPLQAQITYSNITTPIADLITAGQLTAAIAAFQGMIDDDLVPPKYAALITSAIALITAQEAAFAALTPPAPAPTGNTSAAAQSTAAAPAAPTTPAA